MIYIVDLKPAHPAPQRFPLNVALVKGAKEIYFMQEWFQGSFTEHI